MHDHMDEQHSRQRLRRYRMQRIPKVIAVRVQAQRRQHRARHHKPRQQYHDERHQNQHVKCKLAQAGRRTPTNKRRKRVRRPLRMQRAMGEQRGEKDEAQPFVHGDARCRWKQDNHRSDKRREIDGEVLPIHTTSPSSRASRDRPPAQPAAAPTRSSLRRKVDSSEWSTSSMRGTPRSRTTPRGKPSHAPHRARERRRSHDKRPTRTRWRDRESYRR